MLGNFGGAIMGAKYCFALQWERGHLLRRCGGQGAHAAKTMEPRGFSRVAAAFSSYDGDLSLPLGLALGSPIFPWSCEGKLGVLLESLQGQIDLIEACVQDLTFLSQEGRDLGVAFQAPPGSQASSRGEAKDSALLSSRDAGLLEPPERPQGSPASSSVWREDPGLLSRPCRKRRPSAREDGGVSGVSSSCGARGGFLPRHDEDLREPLVRRQGSQVSMRVARGSASWLSSHGRGLGPRDALKKDSRGLCRGAAGNPRVPRLLPGTLGNFPGCL